MVPSERSAAIRSLGRRAHNEPRWLHNAGVSRRTRPELCSPSLSAQVMAFKINTREESGGREVKFTGGELAVKRTLGDGDFGVMHGP
ncbi:hypothetical protein DV515_00006759 [Chloebia gouldiae]|uniref:Uncharacterized protein n=1 Tax=Chloebia gouldiae TaxID=44316 RepID=A0A3L8SKH5_CHLGU|nr:hypothetical protein DV515_00006759 [Chloebia gouldiae]